MQNQNNHQNNQHTHNNFDDFLKRVSGSLNTSPENLESAAKSGKLNEILKGMDQKKLAQVEKILKNREETERILNSPQAQELMRRLNKKKGDDLSG